MQLTNESVSAMIERQFPGIILSREEPHGMLTLETTRDKVVDLLRFVKNDPHLNVNFLTSLCGMHFPEKSGQELGVVYHLHSFYNNFRFRVKVFFSINDPHCPSMTSLWPAANWMERQEFDFFGIIFDGHPDLRRILNVDDLDVYPMRKEYKLEDGTRTDKDDRFFGRDGHVGRSFD